MSDYLGIVVVTYNSAATITGLLTSLKPALGSFRAHLVIVDNGSTDDTVRRAECFAEPGLTCAVVRSANGGYSAGINIGIKALPETSAVLILNPDVRLRPDAVVHLMSALASDKVGIVVPRLNDAQGHRLNSLRREPTLGRASGLGFTKSSLFSEYITSDREYDRPHPVAWATGAALLLSRACYEDIGEWDESYFLYSEETDYCMRAADAGWLTMYEPKANAMHIGGGSGRNDTTHTMQIVNRVRFYVRRNGRLKGWAYYALTVLSEATWVLRGHEQSRASVIALLIPGKRPQQLGTPALLPK